MAEPEVKSESVPLHPLTTSNPLLHTPPTLDYVWQLGMLASDFMKHIIPPIPFLLSVFITSLLQGQSLLGYTESPGHSLTPDHFNSYVHVPFLVLWAW